MRKEVKMVSISEILGIIKTSSTQGVQNVSTDDYELLFNYDTLAPIDDFVQTSSKNEVQFLKVPDTICSQTCQKPVNDFFERNKMGTYDWILLKDNLSAIKSSQQHLLGLIKYYEGDRHHYYEGYTARYRDNDGIGTWTGGFGSTKDTNIKTNEQAYARLLEDLKEHTAYVIEKSGEPPRTAQFENFKKIPASVREALIDLSFNKGPDEINKKTLQDAITKQDWSTIIPILLEVSEKEYLTPENRAGLYRRSLSRAILALRDLKGDELKQAKVEVENIYNKCKTYYEKNNICKSRTGTDRRRDIRNYDISCRR